MIDHIRKEYHAEGQVISFGAPLSQLSGAIAGGRGFNLNRNDNAVVGFYLYYLEVYPTNANDVFQISATSGGLVLFESLGRQNRMDAGEWRSVVRGNILQMQSDNALVDFRVHYQEIRRSNAA